jgi:hypothetical protein
MVLLPDITNHNVSSANFSAERNPTAWIYIVRGPFTFEEESNVKNDIFDLAQNLL